MTELRKALEEMADRLGGHDAIDLRRAAAALASQLPPPTDDVNLHYALKLARDELSDQVAGDGDQCSAAETIWRMDALSAQLPPPDDGPFRVHTTDGGRVIVGEAGPLGLQFLCEICADQTHHMLAKADRIAAALNATSQLPPQNREEGLTWLRSRLEEALVDERDCISIHLTACDAQRLLEALATPSSPEGWVLVERAELADFENTIANLIAEVSDPGSGALAAHHRIKAMLAASPSSGEVGAVERDDRAALEMSAQLTEDARRRNIAASPSSKENKS